jgi:hypothetical protein
MKYLKLFEAFESLKLSKVLNFLNKSSQSKFIDEVKLICDYIDYPISKLTDDDFEYVPYRKALSINRPDADGKLELIKFWFDKDGNYITKTCINGRSIDNYMFSSKKVSDYVIGDNITRSDLNGLPVGTKIYLSCSDGAGVGYLYKYSSHYFILQDFAYGTTPSDYGDEGWREISRKSWIISGEDDYYVMKLAYPKLDNLKDGEEGDFNIGFNISNNYISYIQSDIKDSNFALILNLSNLKGISLKDIRSERKDRKTGAFTTDEEIKKANIERYLNNILGIDSFISNPDKVISRLIKSDYLLFLISATDIVYRLKNINNKYYEIIKSNEYNKEYIIEDIKELYKNNKKYTNEISNNIERFKKSISKWKTTKDPDDLVESVFNPIKSRRDYDKIIEAADKQVDLLLEVSKNIKDILLSNKIETIYDLEIIIHKISLINNIFSDSKNYSRSVSGYFLSNSKSDYESFFLTLLHESYNDPIEWVEKGYPRIKELIKRL